MDEVWEQTERDVADETVPPARYLTDADLRPRRRTVLPGVLFALTCLSTFWAGATQWQPLWPSATSVDAILWRSSVLSHFGQGGHYMLCVLAILLTHEMGHFLATVMYRIPASLPFFIPFPLSPIGTLGAVIGMRSQLADRRQIFDIGIAGPLAGLVVAIPIIYLGIMRLQPDTALAGGDFYDCPLLIRWMIRGLRPELGLVTQIPGGQLNAYFMAGWVGLLITGLNMVPVSQLDGGHIIYAMFGKRAHWLARTILLAAMIYVVVTRAYMWTLMIVLVTLLGTDHPPTANDRVQIGWPRYALGCLSLVIPIVCFPPQGIMMT